MLRYKVNNDPDGIDCATARDTIGNVTIDLTTYIHNKVSSGWYMAHNIILAGNLPIGNFGTSKVGEIDEYLGEGPHIDIVMPYCSRVIKCGGCLMDLADGTLGIGSPEELLNVLHNAGLREVGRLAINQS